MSAFCPGGSQRNLVAVLIPAFNEVKDIAGVVREFAAVARDLRALGLHSELHIIDNGSTDGTGQVAEHEMRLLTNCRLHRVATRGKGNAIRWAFSNIQADLYALVDADLSYSLGDIPSLVKLVRERACDMAIGDRLSGGAYRQVHGTDFRWAANYLVSWVVAWGLEQHRVDALSGLRVLDGHLARSLDLREGGFALETELMFEVARLRGRVQSLPVSYRGRPIGHKSKLVTWRDGPPILWTLLRRLLAHHSASRCATVAELHRGAAGAHSRSAARSER